jgi:hypothetical protein
MAADYRLMSRWTVPLSRDAMWDVLDELLASSDPMVWWPAVQVRDYDGARMALRASSPFGYALTFTLHDLTTRRPDTLSFSATGDLRGAGVVRLADDGAGTSMTIDWRVDTTRRWMRWTAWALRPFFVRGHRQVMRQGERRLTSWLADEGSPVTRDPV